MHACDVAQAAPELVDTVQQIYHSQDAVRTLEDTKREVTRLHKVLLAANQDVKQANAEGDPMAMHSSMPPSSSRSRTQPCCHAVPKQLSAYFMFFLAARLDPVTSIFAWIDELSQSQRLDIVRDLVMKNGAQLFKNFAMSDQQQVLRYILQSRPKAQQMQLVQEVCLMPWHLEDAFGGCGLCSWSSPVSVHI